MQIALPKSDSHPQVRVTVKTAAGDIQITTDDSHRVLEVNLPAGVAEEDVEVIAEFCTRSGQPDPSACQIILKERELDDVPDGSQTEPHEDDVPVRLEDPAPESGSESDIAHAEVVEESASDADPSGASNEVPQLEGPVNDGKEAATDRKPS